MKPGAFAVAVALLVGIILTISVDLGGILAGRAQSERHEACVAALDDYRDTLRITASAIGQHPDRVPDRSAPKIAVDLQAHEQECRAS